MEIEDKLAVELEHYKGNFLAPFIDLKKKTFDGAKFTGCEYGSTLFKHRKVCQISSDIRFVSKNALLMGPFSLKKCISKVRTLTAFRLSVSL